MLDICVSLVGRIRYFLAPIRVVIRMLGQGKPLGTWGCVSVRNECRTSSFGVFELWDRGVVCGK